MGGGYRHLGGEATAAGGIQLGRGDSRDTAGWAEGPGMGVSLHGGGCIEGHDLGQGDFQGAGCCPVPSCVSPAQAAVGATWEKLGQGEVPFQSPLQLLDGFSALFAFATRW